MSDPKSGTYVSLTDEHTSNKDKELATKEAVAQDSGFISSSSVFLSSDDLAVDDHDVQSINTNNNTKAASSSSTSSLANSFQSNSNNNNSSHHLDDVRQQAQTNNTQKCQAQSCNLDSGLIADAELSDDESEQAPEHIAAEQINEMLIDVGINQWMCDRSAIGNDLDSCGAKTTPALVPRPAPMEAMKHMPLWQVCYTQDEEGDT